MPARPAGGRCSVLGAPLSSFSAQLGAGADVQADADAQDLAAGAAGEDGVEAQTVAGWWGVGGRVVPVAAGQPGQRDAGDDGVDADRGLDAHTEPRSDQA